MCFFSQCHYHALSSPCQMRYQLNPRPQAGCSEEPQGHSGGPCPSLIGLSSLSGCSDSGPRPPRTRICCAPKASSHIGSGRFHRPGALRCDQALITLVNARLMCCFGFPAQIKCPTWSVDFAEGIRVRPPAVSGAKNIQRAPPLTADASPFGRTVVAPELVFSVTSCGYGLPGRVSSVFSSHG